MIVPVHGLFCKTTHRLYPPLRASAGVEGFVRHHSSRTPRDSTFIGVLLESRATTDGVHSVMQSGNLVL